MLKDRTSRKYPFLLSPASLLMLGFALVVIILYSLESQSMFGFFKRTEVQLSPPVKGRITNNGEPLSGIEVIRELFYEGYDKENAVIDYALTNMNGEFSFDEKMIKSRYPGDIFGENLPVSQQIYIKKDLHEKLNDEDRNYWIWRISKNWKSFSILNDLMLRLNAELQNKEVQHEVDLSQYEGRYNQPIVSICYWHDELITTYYNSQVITSSEDIKH